MLGRMEDALVHWNARSPDEAAQDILPCCGSQAWAQRLAALRPIQTSEQMLELAAEVWRRLPADDWQEAFESHPRIGERKAVEHATEQSGAWSAEEQRSAATPDAADRLAAANHRYEARFGRIFLVCASGKSAPQILMELEQRLGNDADTELRIAAEEQRRITELRLRRWLGESAR